jgi:hypothetical protein
MLAPFRFADGTNLLPGASWVNENTTGFYRFDGGDLRIAVLTADIMRWNASGAQLYNSVTLAWDAVAVVGGSGTVPNGTTDGDTLVWDQTTDQAWEIQAANPAGLLPVGTDGQTLRYELSTNTWDATSAIVIDDASVSTISSLVVTGEITANGGLALGDNDKATFGVSDDLEIYHSGANSYITDVGTGNLIIGGANVEITTAGGTKYLQGAANVLKLYHTGNEKLRTSAAGIDVTGDVTATGNISAATYTGLPVTSETVSGIIELATQVEVNTGTDAVRAVTPATLATSPYYINPVMTAVKTTTYTAVANDLIPIDTSGGAWTLTLPVSPSVDDRVYFFDYGQTFNTNNLTIARNGEKIMNLAEDLTADVQFYSGSLLYVNATQGWILA